MRMRTTTTTAIATTLVVALIAGCGGGNEKKSDPASQRGGSVEEQLGFDQADSPEARAKIETDIAACMKAEGLEYTPVDPITKLAALTGKSNISDEDFDRQFGYGIATLYGRGTPQSDPNARIRASLSPADQRAYDRALTGGKPEQTFVRAADTGDYSGLGGCTKQATEGLFGSAELLTTLQRKKDELDEAILQDQRVVRAFEAWTRCVRDRTGETFEDSEDVEVDIQNRLAAIVGPLPPGESAPGEFASHVAKRPVDQRALAALRQLEVEFAAADIACEDKHITKVEDVVTKEKEKVFLDANAELLRRVKPGG